ncbi:MAG: hypothetical protein P1U40_04115 [Coxiellaceae bacterium]|nr:hypothetical protein [Coxiellaceae bacterium]
MTTDQVLDELHDCHTLTPETQQLVLEHYATLSIEPANSDFKRLNAALNNDSLQEHWRNQMLTTYGVYPEPPSTYATGRSNFQIFCSEWAVQQYCKTNKTEKHYYGLSMMMGHYRTLAIEVMTCAKLINKASSKSNLMLYPILKGLLAALQSCEMHGAMGYDLLAYMYFVISLADAYSGKLNQEKHHITQQVLALSTASSHESSDAARRNAGFFSTNKRYQKLNLSQKRGGYQLQAKKRLTLFKYLMPPKTESTLRIETEPEAKDAGTSTSYRFISG